MGETNSYFTDGNYGESYPKESELSDKENGVPFLRGSNLRNGELIEDNANYITKEKHAELTSGHLVEDDIVLAVRGSLGALGYVKDENIDWNINSQLAVIRTDKSELSGKFLVQFLLSWRGQKELLSRNTGTALKQLPIKQLKDVPVPIVNLDEQKEIGALFSSIDNLIAATQDKIDILEQISLALKRHLYNHSWSFKDEDEPWIIQTLNNSTSKIKSYSLIRSVETLTNTGYKYIHYGDIHTGKVTLINSVETLPNIPAGNYELLSKGDLILADASEDYKGIADAAILLDTDDQRVVAGLHTIALRPQNTDPVFLYYLFQTEKFKTFARKMGTGLKVFGISYSNLVRFKFASPSKTLEQQRIGNLLLTIENLLRATTTSLKALRSVKQSLLQNLFM
ncbi:restriction endonuclease subunit S [Lacticaseibacillus paracasei]|uniref:restriction endonuclease subunit S n=1 Tax=Lacticaseibacillus paracasei TaxID=1597 RepID=UPI001E347138|nr:restriction endonuclease subunit S [Lacticaseibacillus paracasei]